jgi:hypothetical protein
MKIRIPRGQALAFTAFAVAASLTAITAASAGKVILNQKQEARLLTIMSTRTPVASLGSLPGMTPELLSRVVAFRKSGKEFSSVAQFKEVLDLSEEQFDKLAAFFAGVLVPKGQADTSGADSLVAGRPLPEEATARAKRRAARASKRSAAEQPEARAKEGLEGGSDLNLEVKANYYSVLPGYDLSSLPDLQRKEFLETINREMCPCGCEGETLGYCLVNDPGCMVVKARVGRIYKEITGQEPPRQSSADKR